MNSENKAHDLGIAFLSYQLQIELSDTDSEHGEEVLFEMYKSAYDKFYEMLMHGV